MLEVAIKQLLDGITEPLTGRHKVRPVFATGKLPFVTYTITPISGGTVKESQVEIKSIADNLDQAVEIRDAIVKRLDMTAQVPSLEVSGLILRSELAGGGMIFNDSIQTWELSSIFIVTWRYKNEQYQ